MKTAVAKIKFDSPPESGVFPAPFFIKRFGDITIKDIPIVGGKTASLGEMFRELAPQGVKVPDEFAITAEAYRYFLRKDGLDKRIDKLFEGLDTRDIDALRRCGLAIREEILSTPLPTDLETEILGAYDELRASSKTVAVAVRSSATAEDLPDASFAGAQQTFLNVEGHSALLEACRRCFASLFTDRAISYRVDKGFDHHKVALSIAVQRMVRSDLAASGVMFREPRDHFVRDDFPASALSLRPALR